ncbi:MAG: HAD-IIB family hydrolase [Nitrospirales bacterium]|nr:HAD-IIB family hydrolase [Nitrospirales bacterium]
MSKRLIVFTDLDGSLLDPETYRYDAATPALDQLAAQDVPLIFCTSKTRAEVEPLRIELGNTCPFIIENGGAVYIPEGYFPQMPPNAVLRNAYHVLEFGVPYGKLREGLRVIEDKAGIRLKGFGDMNVEEVMAATGLSAVASSLAQQREYDEPFLLNDLSKLFELRHEAANQGLLIVQAGRFGHLVGGTHKGQACRVLIELYQQHWGEVTTAAFGDSLNDLPMLEKVDYPFLVERRGGGHEPGIAFKGLITLEGIGPEGWAKGINQLLEDM